MNDSYMFLCVSCQLDVAAQSFDWFSGFPVSFVIGYLSDVMSIKACSVSKLWLVCELLILYNKLFLILN